MVMGDLHQGPVHCYVYKASMIRFMMEWPHPFSVLGAGRGRWIHGALHHDVPEDFRDSEICDRAEAEVKVRVHLGQEILRGVAQGASTFSSGARPRDLKFPQKGIVSSVERASAGRCPGGDFVPLHFNGSVGRRLCWVQAAGPTWT